jgi:hypothetical protein
MVNTKKGLRGKPSNPISRPPSRARPPVGGQEVLRRPERAGGSKMGVRFWGRFWLDAAQKRATPNLPKAPAGPSHSRQPKRDCCATIGNSHPDRVLEHLQQNTPRRRDALHRLAQLSASSETPGGRWFRAEACGLIGRFPVRACPEQSAADALGLG